MGYMGMTCYQCHSGPLCKEMQDTKSCELNVGNGNPLFIAEYWRNKSHHDPCTGVLGHYRSVSGLIIGGTFKSVLQTLKQFL